ncbi:MAG TPA: orotate phosphoribosyltransferase [Candidatus Borkfalkia avicola]|uniref:Orotate phosphoribosyltransferase n=1 Tax=Candidatus Borkfalkia avicola TaxID=2838503 RepID=A0A9D2D843_9FIRM|nr:orotate phosphoribosyltransferase [Candidatus Borkfalkia avicola]
MNYKEQFIRFLAECGVLKFGTFRLKSGRIAPYFLNAGEYKTGAQIKRLGEFYADCIVNSGVQADVLFGPAYKGIPLAISASVALYEKYGKNVGFCFDRKEVKDHGEGGMFVGTQPKDGGKVVIIEDVMTSGKALKEVLPKLRGAAKVDVAGMIITVDRMEKALDSDRSAVQQAYAEEGVKVYSIVTIQDIIAALEAGIIDGREHVPAIRAYLEEYGAKY